MIYLLTAMMLTSCSVVTSWMPHTDVSPLVSELDGDMDWRDLRRKFGNPEARHVIEMNIVENGLTKTVSGQKWLYRDYWWTDDKFTSFDIYIAPSGRVTGWMIAEPHPQHKLARSVHYEMPSSAALQSGRSPLPQVHAPLRGDLLRGYRKTGDWFHF
jgi:hypothetical protein